MSSMEKCEEPSENFPIVRVSMLRITRDLKFSPFSSDAVFQTSYGILTRFKRSYFFGRSRFLPRQKRKKTSTWKFYVRSNFLADVFLRCITRCESAEKQIFCETT